MSSFQLKIKSILACLFILAGSGHAVTATGLNDTTVFLLTIGPGTETYSIYGHSALRVVNMVNKTDTVYNWGVFDFSTPNFAWKFAKGRLEYMLDADQYNRFLRMYIHEQRFMWSQKVNLTPAETEKLMVMINENLKPENLRYRYDFFYDDCSTRIRDLLEKAVGNLEYPEDSKEDKPTFREMVGKYQRPYPWLQFGIDLIMGSPGDIKAGVRERMFLPIDMQIGLSDATINRDGEKESLLQKPAVILDFEAPVPDQNSLTSPMFLFTLLLLLVIIFSVLVKAKVPNDVLDILLYAVFSVLSLLMVFFNFFTDHQQMKWNFNIVWLNPILIICLFQILFSSRGTFWFRLIFYITAAFLIAQFLIPQSFNLAVYPLVFIILIRSSVRAGLSWNPLTI